MATPNKVRKEKLSIYLARDGNKSDSEIIKLENVKDPIHLDLPEADTAVLYIKKQPPQNIPPWAKIFTSDRNVEPSILE